MTEWVGIAGIAAGAFGGMAAALSYGFKRMVDVVFNQLTEQNASIKLLENNIEKKMDSHIADCKICQTNRLGGQHD